MTGFTNPTQTEKRGAASDEAAPLLKWAALVVPRSRLRQSAVVSNPGSSSIPRSTGVIGQDWYATHVAARLQDFFFVTAPWQRRLWDAGTVFALKELLDASRWRAEHVLSEGAVHWLSHELERIVGVDHGVGDRATKVAITAELKTGCRTTPGIGGAWTSSCRTSSRTTCSDGQRP